MYLKKTTLTFLLALSTAVSAGEVCTLVMDTKSRTAMYWQGSCNTRFTPASTFKVPLAVMGYDSGFLQSDAEPTLDYRVGEIDWGGAAWKEPTGPQRWMRLSVVWYSQRIATALGAEKLHRYARAFQYGNADLSGDPGVSASERPAWLASSLLVSPLEQAAFISRLARDELPVSQTAMANAKRLLEVHQVGEWTVRGKTGTAFPRDAAGKSDESRGHGWYVGWAEKEGHSVAFSYLIQDTARQQSPAGIRARGQLLQKWPSIATQLGR